MTNAQTDKSIGRKPLRLWPGVILVAVQWLAWLVFSVLFPGQGGTEVLVAAACGLGILLWWLFFSRAAWSERLGAILLMVVAVIATKRVVHESIANGMMGYMLYIYSIPALCLALVIWAVVTRGLSTGVRRATMVAAILLTCATFLLIRTNGITGEADSDLAWRWTPTAEQRLLEQAGDEPMPLPTPPAATTQVEKQPAPSSTVQTAPTQTAVTEAAKKMVLESEQEPAAIPADSTEADADVVWSGFRGPERDSVVRGVRIKTDWSASPPVELWRRPIGPAWSSFAVDGEFVYTQEQRGDDEDVSCYNLKTGEPVWRHHDAARFWESNAGAGPRATPTLSNGRVYTLGGTGILNALDARDGSVIWSRNAVSDTGKKIPDWGIASSPLVVDDVVVVATAGWLAGYDLATGNPRWFGPKDGYGYSSPQLAMINGVAQVVLLNGDGAISLAPSDGKLLWKHEWPSDGIVQPAVIAGSDILLGSGSGMATNNGMSRVTVAHESDKWTVKEDWTSNGLKPYFNDFVVHNDHAFGFDGSFLSCINLKDGARKWKGGRYGHGQMLLLADQGLLLVLSEQGDVALVSASPDQFTELARIPAIKGKTWNHPVLAGDVLLVRNNQEMAAFRLSLAGD